MLSLLPTFAVFLCAIQNGTATQRLNSTTQAVECNSLEFQLMDLAEELWNTACGFVYATRGFCGLNTHKRQQRELQIQHNVLCSFVKSAK